MEPIARIHTDFPEKFGVPRQAGLVPALEGRIVFEPKYRCDDAIRGIEGFSHLWLIWECTQAPERWSATVRPPRLGGNVRMGVFATRSPVRPNRIGLSSVRLVGVDPGPELIVAGADLVDGTPLWDIKPYVPSDVHAEASFGFIDGNTDYRLEVFIPDKLLCRIPEDRREALIGVLSEDPRPAYQRDQRVYGLAFAGYNVRFHVEGRKLVVQNITALG